MDFPAKGTQFVYHHNQLVAEIPLQTDGNAALAENWEEAIYWLYQDDDFTPTARLHKGELHYTVSDQIGTITELISENGYIHYRQKLNLWGEAQSETLHHQRASNDEILCNLRFVGQYADEESGLYYNRFRYYSPETGQYISSDPIGLLGGFNPYGYVGIPTGFVDPLGLAGCPVKKYEVGLFDDLSSRSIGDGLDIHHVGQKKIMQRLVKGYDPKKAPSIAVPADGHTRRDPLTNNRISTKDLNPITNKPFDNPRDLLARDIKELRRVYPDIPNSKLKELINLNKKMYPEMRK